MKSGESFQLTEAWWKAGKPLVLTDTGLGAALRKFHEADQKFQSGKSMETYFGVMSALRVVNEVRLATITKCGNNVLLKDTKAALMKDGAITQRKTIVTKVISEQVDAAVKKVEQELVTENGLSENRAKALKLLVPKLSEARKTGNQTALALIGKELARQAENASLSKASTVTAQARGVLEKLGGYGTEFPGPFERIKKVISKSMENEKVANALIKLANDNEDILSND